MNEKHGLEFLDSIVVIFTLVILGFIAWALVFRQVPENQLAILASIASALIGGVIGAYAGYRWATSKQATETIANLAAKAPVAPVLPQKVEEATINADTATVVAEKKE